MSNTFDGKKREFCRDASVRLVTHFHADHLVGILNRRFTGLIYCSQATKKLMEAEERYSSILILLPSLVEKKVYVTLIEAYHCRSDASVLCTGDVRTEQWWRAGLRHLPFLQPYMTGEKGLCNIYLDSAFYYRMEPYIEIPPNNMSIHTAVCLLKKYLMDDPEIMFEFTDTTLGFEEVLRKRLKVTAGCDHVNNHAITQAMNAVPVAGAPVFHVGCTLSPYFVRISEFINFNIMDFAGVCCPIQVANIPAHENMELLHTTQKRTRIFYFCNRKWLLPKDGAELFPQNIMLAFSRHLSYTETVEFLKMFRPRQLYPICNSKLAWRNGFTMKRLYGDVCTGTKFAFDEKMLELCGNRRIAPSRDLL
ncbi:hypothetical protein METBISCDRAFT_30700 [Metschnikowia bicuspidata]|uniref:Metallo-beta-lactamase domain-containing protein n=1 Tax=Metschnikowia bicuspidata TaxID=27322 RepID=A0A4P9ZCU7_9ASCO|nr:hypothetical protein METBISCDRAFT_30700 [Metschnikowia bicuspidata]